MRNFTPKLRLLVLLVLLQDIRPFSYTPRRKGTPLHRLTLGRRTLLNKPVACFSRKQWASSSDEEESTLFNGLDLQERLSSSTKESRRRFLASALLGAGTLLTVQESSHAVASTTSPSTLPWKTDPVNKRTGVTLVDAESAGYNVGFVTYLSRFLLNFDANCQRFWFSEAIPQTASSKKVEEIRLQQFAAFSASVEVGLQEYKGKEGALLLLQDLVARYGTLQADDPSQRRVARSARRHIALLFALMEKNQPTAEITKLLASVDNGKVTSVQLLKNEEDLSGFETNQALVAEFPNPQAGDDYEMAQGRVVLKPTGRLLRVDILNGGSGYSSVTPPIVTISSPLNGTCAQAQVKISKGSIARVQLVDAGSGYTELKDIRITVSPPPSDTRDGQMAHLAPVLDMRVDRIEITKEGSGYAAEKPLKVFLRGRQDTNDTVLVGFANPSAEKSSFTSFRRKGDQMNLDEMEDAFEKKYNLVGTVSGADVSGLDSGAPPLPFWGGKSSSAELLRLLPAGVGLEYDSSLRRYVLALDTDFMKQYPAVLQQGGNRILGTDFGPRGSAPIERKMELGASAYLKFCISGAICSSGVHLVLTPLDVVKTKMQTNPSEKYSSIGTSFGTVLKEEGVSTLFTGLGFFQSVKDRY